MATVYFFDFFKKNQSTKTVDFDFDEDLRLTQEEIDLLAGINISRDDDDKEEA